MPTLNEWTESEIADHLDAAHEGVAATTPFVLVSHQPPVDTVVDRAGVGKHVGSAAVRHFIERHRPMLCVSGHIHEAQGTDRIGDTLLINPGPFLDGQYAWIEIDGRECHAEVRRAPAFA
jgi:Icc-related predicted phosphoesterase